MPILVHSVPMSVKKFTKKDIDISKKYINPEVYPGLYGPSELPKNLKFISRQLIDIDDFLIDDEGAMDKSVPTHARHGKTNITNQTARANSRGEYANHVHHSLRTFGYKLDNIPMSIAVWVDGSKYMINGRTRLEELRRQDFKNIIADVYECTSWEAYHDAKQLFNVRSDPYSPHTMEDIVTTCQLAISKGWIKSTYDDILKKVNEVAPGCFLDSEVNKIVFRAMNSKSLQSTAYTTKGAAEDLRKFGYIDNHQNNGIYYFVYSAEGSVKMIPTAAKYLSEILHDKKVKELRIVIHTGTLQGADPEASWKSKIDNCRNAWRHYLQYIKDSYFGTEIKDVIKLYGAMPAVASLADKYPMDKLVMFHVGQLRTKTFSEIDLEENMNKMVGIGLESFMEEDEMV